MKKRTPPPLEKRYSIFFLGRVIPNTVVKTTCGENSASRLENNEQIFKFSTLSSHTSSVKLTKFVNI